MKLRSVEFGSVFNASGARGFFGEGYWYHKLLSPFGLRWDGSTFIAKTSTIEPRRGSLYKEPGNMLMTADGLRPRHWFPDCVVVKPRWETALNAVGLSGPGLEALLAANRWQRFVQPFVVSFMATASKKADRLLETKRCAVCLGECFQNSMRVALELNLTCLNVGHNVLALVEEAREQLDILSSLNIPLIVKINVHVDLTAAWDISRHPACDALDISNTVHWDTVPAEVRMMVFGTTKSPLAKYGGGGWSGSYLRGLVYRWLKEARSIICKPVIVGGGLLCKRHIKEAKDLGAAAVSLGSVAMLYPWRVAGMIRYANALFS